MQASPFFFRSRFSDQRSARGQFVVLSALLMLLVAPVHAGSLVSGLPDFTKLVEQNSPSVVNIATSKLAKTGEKTEMPQFEMPEIPDGTPFGELFKRLLPKDGNPHGGPHGGPHSGPHGHPFMPRDEETHSLGSGIIISSDGYIMTNHHVIDDADEIIVRLSDRRELAAKVVGSDKRSDIALLKVEATGLPAAVIGSSDKLKVGEWVLAIGSPFGFDHSVTAGIVSGFGRNFRGQNYVPFIQTDVAINPGNSGGPLINLNGEVVGVNAQIYSRSGGYMGLSFTIPIDVAMEVVEQLKATGHVQRGWLGVLIQDVTRELADSFGMKKPSGALVAKVLEGSPAEKAGIQVGDVVVNYDGHVINDSASLPPIVGRTHVGNTVKVEVIRAGNRKTLDLTIGELPDQATLASAAGSPDEPAVTHTDRLGVAVSELDDEQRDQLKLPENGVLVSKVMPGPAYHAGIRPGDVILMLNGVTVKGADHFHEIVDQIPAGERSIAALVHRRSGPVFLALKIKE